MPDIGSAATFTEPARANVYRLSERAALHELPQGPWSLHVTPDGIDIEVNGTARHLAPDDILEADLRTLRGEKGKDAIMSAVQVRLRPGAPAVSLTRDGWLPVYRKPMASSSQTPTELVAALHALVGSRLGPRLTGLAKNACPDHTTLHSGQGDRPVARGQAHPVQDQQRGLHDGLLGCDWGVRSCGRIAGSSASRSAASGCSHSLPGRSPACICTGHVNRTATFRSPLAYVRHRS